MDKLLPHSFEETILTYLRSQVAAPEDLSFDLEEVVVNPEDEIKIILEEIILKVNKRIACRDRYENLKTWHNQYPLFDLTMILPDFCIDKKMIKKLCFKESLLISAIETGCEEVEPHAIGALSLFIESVDAHVSDERKVPIDEALDLEIYHAVKRAKKVLSKQSVVDLEQLDVQIKEKLEEYEQFLKNETLANIKKFVVHVSSQFDVEGRNAGSNIISWIDRQFHTLEEKRNEWIHEDNSINEKHLYVGLQRNKYYVHHRYERNDVDDRKYYSLTKTRDMVCEGANFVLMRYLALTKYSGTFELSTMYINGSMCRNIYQCTGPVKGMIDDKEVHVCKIYRFIVEECGIEHHCVTVLTIHGHLISQEWDGCGVIINRNPIYFMGNSPYERLILEKSWMDNMELHSKYLDYKTRAELKMKRYISDHSEVQDILADYVNNILLMKPENILNFTVDYFESLSPFRLARSAYLEGEDNHSDDDSGK